MDSGIPSGPPASITSGSSSAVNDTDSEFSEAFINESIDELATQNLISPLIESLIVQIISDNLLPDVSKNPFLDEDGGGVISF